MNSLPAPKRYTPPAVCLTADPDFADLALDEIRRAAPGAVVDAGLAPGVWLVEAPGGFTAVAERWHQAPPIFVRHICPVELAAPLAGAAGDIAALARLLGEQLLGPFDPELPFSVQSRILAASGAAGSVPYKPFDLNSALAEVVEKATGAPLKVRAPEQVLSVVIAAQTAYLGVSPVAYNLSDWAGGMRRFAREEGQISRAEFKLLEALEYFSLPLPPRGVALDLGAAPGGWSRVLRQRQQYVTAVDPAALHPSLVADPGVRHKQMTAEAYLAEGPDSFDLIVNDMRLDARDSARLMVAYAPYLYRHGEALMTFKLPEEGRQKVLDHAFTILRQAYDIAGARQLFHNRSEITVHLRPKGGFPASRP